jgi:signal peptidase I
MGKVVRGLLWIAAIVFLFGLGLRATFLDALVVPDDDKTSAAVAPSLAGGDTVIYFRRNKPAFADLVRCTDPDDATRFVFGRVVGLDGDVVETNGAELAVNGKRYYAETACAQTKYTVPHPTAGSTVDLRCDQVSMGGHPHLRGQSEKAGIFSPTKTTVGAGMVFLLSDDRSYHDDSRDFGTVRADTCTGRIFFRVVGKEGWSDDKRRMTFVQ